MSQSSARKIARVARDAGVPKHTAREVLDYLCRPVLDKNGDIRLLRVRRRSHREKGELDVVAELHRLDAVGKELVAEARREGERQRKKRAEIREKAAQKLKELKEKRSG